MADLNYIEITDINQLPDNAPENNIYYLRDKSDYTYYMYDQDLSKLGIKTKDAWIYIGFSFGKFQQGRVDKFNMTGYVFKHKVSDFPTTFNPNPEPVKNPDCSMIPSLLAEANEYVGENNIYVSTQDGNLYLPSVGGYKPNVIDFDTFVRTIINRDGDKGAEEVVTKTSLDK